MVRNTEDRVVEDEGIGIEEKELGLIIEVKSVVGRGSTFTVTLPRKSKRRRR